MQNLEALYLVEFGDVATPGQMRNGGVAVLKTGRIFGGDSGYYYIGEYAVSGNALTASLRIVKHNPSWNNAFGDTATSFQIKVNGTIQGEVMSGNMARLDMPGRQLPIRLTRKEALP
jgi:hypothetical protein